MRSQVSSLVTDGADVVDPLPVLVQCLRRLAFETAVNAGVRRLAVALHQVLVQNLLPWKGEVALMAAKPHLVSRGHVVPERVRGAGPEAAGSASVLVASAS